MPKIVVSFALDTEADRDLVRWLERLPKRRRSEAIREALRSHLRGGVTLGDVYQAVRELERRLKTGVIVTACGEKNDDDWNEPADLVAALEALAARGME